MEVIKKKIKRFLKLENNKIIPDKDANYYMKISLTSKSVDLGFFDVFDSYYGYNYYGYDNIFNSPIGIVNLL